MIYFANPTGSPEVHAVIAAGTLGYIDTPSQGNYREPDWVWCADNGCFSDAFDENAWWSWLTAKSTGVATCKFAVAPDVVGDAWRSHLRSAPWLPKIRALGYPVAYVAQNGIERLPVPWRDFDALFIGGTLECLHCNAAPWRGPGVPAPKQACFRCGRLMTEWKLGSHVRLLVQEAKARGKWVHMGRVNSERRAMYAAAIGCDSVDGTYLVRGPLVNLPKLERWMRRVRNEPPLFHVRGSTAVLGEATS